MGYEGEQAHRGTGRCVAIISDSRPLVIASLKDKISLVTPETHKKYITEKLKKEISLFRPDIAHRCLLSLQDSPLNKAGLLRVYVHTMDNVLIEIDPSCRVIADVI